MKCTKATAQWTIHCTIDGKDYERFSATIWGEWVGESLELVQMDEDIKPLEAAIQEWSKKFAFKKLDETLQK